MTDNYLNFYWPGTCPPFNLRENLRNWCTNIQLSNSAFKIAVWLENSSLNNIINFYPEEFRRIDDKNHFFQFRWFIDNYQVQLKVFSPDTLFTNYPYSLEHLEQAPPSLVKENLTTLAIIDSMQGILFSPRLQPDFNRQLPQSFAELKQLFSSGSKPLFIGDSKRKHILVAAGRAPAKALLQETEALFSQVSGLGLDIACHFDNALLRSLKVRLADPAKKVPQAAAALFSNDSRFDLFDETGLLPETEEGSGNEQQQLMELFNRWVQESCRFYSNRLNRDNARSIYHYNIDPDRSRVSTLLTEVAAGDCLEAKAAAVGAVFCCDSDSTIPFHQRDDCRPFSLLSFMLNELQCCGKLKKVLNILPDEPLDFNNPANGKHLLNCRRTALCALQDFSTRYQSV